MIAILTPMIVAYGYNRQPQDFASVKPERLWLDVTGSKRQERGAMLANGAIRAEDTLVLLSKSDIGDKRLLREIEARGVTVQEIAPEKPRKPRGRPVEFDLPPEQMKEVAALWHNPGYFPGYVLDRASDLAGFRVTRNHLNRAFGPRYGKQ